MSTFDNIMIEITPQVLLKAYSCGIFPMAESADDPALYWIEPRDRGILPLNKVHIPKRLARTLRSEQFEIRVDSDFDGVIDGCAAWREGRESTWINARIRQLYADLFDLGHCHTIETWKDGKLVGGLYGVHVAGAFFGESMFSTERDASKVALMHLVARLIVGGFDLLDTQFVTDHLSQFGTTKVTRANFQARLTDALAIEGDFRAAPENMSGEEVVEAVRGACVVPA